MIGIDRARLPRLHATSPHLLYRVRRVPQAVKGRRAHPPKVEKIWYQKINKKEKKLALKSAIAATAIKEIVESRGHRINGIKQLPLVVSDAIQEIKKSKDVRTTLENLGLKEELERARIKKVRAGKGKLRGRKYKRRIGPLILIAQDGGVLKAAKNIPGVDVKFVRNVSVEDLAPGASPGRLTIYSRSAIEGLRGL